MKSRFTQGYLVIRVPYSTKRMPYFSISVPYSTQKKSFFLFYPHFLPFSLGIPLFTGVRRREGKQISLPCLKRPVHWHLRGVTGGREGKIAISNSPKEIFVTFGEI